MITVVLLSILFGASLATPLHALWLSPFAPVAPVTQYSGHDGTGSYSYSYRGPYHAKSESSLNGITQGGYSYIDANGILQTVAYTADAQNGFRVRASNLPQQPSDPLRPVEDTAEVAAAKRSHLEELRRGQSSGERDSWQHEQNAPPTAQREATPEAQGAAARLAHASNPFLLSRGEADTIRVPRPDPSLQSLSHAALDDRRNDDAQHLASAAHSTPLARQPIAIQQPHYVLPIYPYRLLHSSLHHIQDSLGRYDYSYTGDTSAKTESRSLDGTTRGAYSYIDANGLLQQVHYVADRNGFRVAATNLPEAK